MPKVSLTQGAHGWQNNVDGPDIQLIHIWSGVISFDLHLLYAKQWRNIVILHKLLIDKYGSNRIKGDINIHIRI